MSERVLLIGSGGREHALAWKLSQSSQVSHIYVAPGNAGTANESENVSNVGLNVKDFESISKWCSENSITFVIVGPEDPLAAGIVDFLSKNAAIQVFGPTSAAANIEADKSFSKHFMVRHGIPTAKFETFTDPVLACKYIKEADHAALVVKASGLAAGKGVVVASSVEEACNAVNSMMTDKAFGAAGDTIVVEELLEGPEVSVLAFSDGKNVFLMPPAQDHKRLKDDDKGPNTGGMGAICPYPGLSQDQLDRIQTDIIEKTIHGMAQEGARFVGVLFAGLMLTKDGPKVLEFNCRFGDPETQSILSLLESDLMPTLKACVSGNLLKEIPKFDQVNSAAGVVLVSGGYPGSYPKGLEISGISAVDQESGIKVFHAGTGSNAEGKVVTSGGRVVAVVAKQPSLPDAMQRATVAAAKISFEGAYFRKDIGAKASGSQLCPESHLKATDKGNGLSYRDAGVDILEGDMLVQAIKPLARSTRRAGCDADLGGFGGLFDLGASGHGTASKLACYTSGVGRKLTFAETCGHHYNVGLDLVAQCVNGLLASGAEPLYILDYYACGKLNVSVAEDVVRGIADGCVEAGCALIGGETAEMPGMYKNKDYDVAGMAVGAISPTLASCPVVAAEDVVVAITSSGLQHHDFELLDNILIAGDLSLAKLKGFAGGATLGEEVLSPMPILVKGVLPLLNAGKVKMLRPVDGGLSHCLSLLVPPGLGCTIDAEAWHLPPVFAWMGEMSKLQPKELLRSCSCGIAAILVVEPQCLSHVVDHLTKSLTDPCKVIGNIVTVAGDADQIVINKAQTAVAASLVVARKEASSNFSCLPEKVIIQHGNIDISSVLDLATRPGTVASKGSVPATFNLQTLGLVDPVLVSGTDGVGTKLKIAQSLQQHSTVGIDLVAMCVNDLLAAGADPMIFTCYLASGSSYLSCLKDVMEGVSAGCRLAGCGFVEQHVSTLPSIYSGDVYDLAGYSVGVVEKSQILPKLSEISPGDILIGLPSSGVHSNGFSLVRRVIEINKLRFDMPSPFTENVSLGHDLLKPTEIYVKSVLPAMRLGFIKGFAHITGGGLIENIPRVLPAGVAVELDARKWTISPVFGWLQYMGKISSYEMSRTFNCGLGAVLVVDAKHQAQVMQTLVEADARPSIIGTVVEAKGKEKTVTISHLGDALVACWSRPPVTKSKKKVGVLISGSGTNLQALIDHTQCKVNNSAAEIALVISNKAKVAGLARAEKAGIKTQVISHRKFKSREEFDDALHKCLIENNIELVCLAGFMRILTGEFTAKWTGRMLNIHPSLLPSFKGAHAHQMALDAGVRISGCSVHFVAEEVDGGAIVCQESVPVYPGDTVDLLSERVKTVEHVAYPTALELVASGRVGLGEDNKLVWKW